MVLIGEVDTINHCYCREVFGEYKCNHYRRHNQGRGYLFARVSDRSSGLEAFFNQPKIFLMYEFFSEH
jgi:hypothetical protein